MSASKRASTRTKAASKDAAGSTGEPEKSKSGVLASLAARHITHDPSAELGALNRLANGTPASAFPYNASKWRWMAVERTPEATKKNPHTFLLVDHADPPTRYLTTPGGAPSSNRGAKDAQIFWSRDMDKLRMPEGLQPADITDDDMDASAAAPAAAAKPAAPSSGRKRKQADGTDADADAAADKAEASPASASKKQKQKKGADASK